MMGKMDYYEFFNELERKLRSIRHMEPNTSIEMEFLGKNIIVIRKVEQSTGLCDKCFHRVICQIRNPSLDICLFFRDSSALKIPRTFNDDENSPLYLVRAGGS